MQESRVVVPYADTWVLPAYLAERCGRGTGSVPNTGMRRAGDRELITITTT